MQTKIIPTKIDGKIKAPPSKSEMIRAVAASALCEEKIVLHNFLFCNDAQTSVNIIKKLGAKVEICENDLHITGEISNNNAVLHCGESALCTKIFTLISTVISNKVEVFGEGSLLKRDIGDLTDALKMLGFNCVGEKFLPISIGGKIQNNNIIIDGSFGSQTLSGLLMALPLCKNDSIIAVNNLKSKPYVDLTISVLSKFGISIENKNYEKFFIGGNQKYTSPCAYNIEGDWSGASCLLVAGAIGGSVYVENLNPKSLQADRAILDVLKLCGSYVGIENKNIIVRKNRLNAFNFDATHCPDLFPAIVALAANCDGTSIIKGAKRLTNKESNRAEILKNEYAKLGIKIEIIDDEMQIIGGKIKSAKVFAHNDHRIAMSLGVVSVCAQGDVVIDNAECVAKSYPNFWSDLKKISK